jgi:oligopeptide/dipeptide ABC transporter ATP-binding protein
VAVIYVGRLVEVADTASLFAAPKHPYTEALLSAVPKAAPRLRARRIVLEGEVADPAHPPGGCYFYPRCPYAVHRAGRRRRGSRRSRQATSPATALRSSRSWG